MSPPVALPDAVYPVEAPAAAAEPEAIDEDYDAYAHEPPFRPRRNPARVWTVVAIAVALVLLAALGALAWFGPERAATALGIRAAEFDTPLIIMSQVDPPQKTPSGNELLSVSGRIVNSAETAQPVPDILVEILNAQGRVIYSWTIPHPVATIPARGSVPFNSATINPPPSGVKLNFVFIGAVRK